MKHLPKHYKWILFVIVVLAALGTAMPVLADYLGPNRTVTTYVSYCRYVQKRCAQQKNGQWEWNTVEDWDCSHGDQGCSGGGGACNKDNNGARSCERDEGVREETVTYDPATITGSIQNCTLQNGWCNGATTPQLSLSANEPVAGYNILLIEGTLNSANFACPASTASCNIPLSQGSNTFNYWALSSWGDSSLMGTSAAQVDTLPPAVNLPHAWQLGRNVDYSVSDEGSGIAALRVVIEDEDERYAKVAWDEESAKGTYYEQDINWDGKFKDGTVAPPGTYLVWIKASDWAGNETFQLGKIIVPEPNYVNVVVLPTEEPLAIPPAPPVELSSSTNSSPSGAVTVGAGTSKHILSGVSGSAGVLPSAASSSSSGVLWGAAAAAIAGAATTYALEITRKRLEAEAEQAAQARAQAGHSGQHLTKEEKRELKAQRAEQHDQRVKERREQQSWANPAKEKAKLKEQEKQQEQQLNNMLRRGEGMTVEFNGSLNNLLGNKSNGNIWVSGNTKQLQDAIDRKLADANKKNPFGTVVGTAGVKSEGTTAEKPSIWKNPVGWFKQTPLYTNVIDPYIVQPVTTFVNTVKNDIQETFNKGISWLNQNVYQPYIAPVVSAVVTGAQDLKDKVVKVFQDHPVIAWGTTATATTVAVASTAYYIDCFINPGVSSNLHPAMMMLLPATGWFTTEKKKRLHGLIVGMLILGTILSACGTGQGTPTPGVIPCPTPDTPAPQTPQTPTPPTALPLTPYVVQAGDSCDAIAGRNHMCLEDFVKLNGNTDCANLQLNTQVYIIPDFCTYSLLPTPSSPGRFPPLPPAYSNDERANAIQFFDYLQGVAKYCKDNPNDTQCPYWAKDGVLGNEDVIYLTSRHEINTTDTVLSNLQLGSSLGPSELATAIMRVDWEKLVVKNCGGDITNSSLACRTAVGEFLGRYQIWYTSDRANTYSNFGDISTPTPFHIDPAYYPNLYWGIDGLTQAQSVLSMNDGDSSNDISYYVDSSCWGIDTSSGNPEAIKNSITAMGYDASYVFLTNRGAMIFMTETQWKSSGEGKCK